MQAAADQRASNESEREAEDRLRTTDVVGRILDTVRRHLGLDVAFVAEFTGGHRTFRYVSSAPGIELIKPGDSDPVEDSYCQRVLDGRLPGFLRDARAHPVAAELPVTHELPIGTHLSVPIRSVDGDLYGTLCTFSTDVHDAVTHHDLRVLEVAAELAGQYLRGVTAARDRRQRRRAAIESLITGDGMTFEFQPLRDLDDMRPIGVEALARFPGTSQGTEWFFAEAHAVGLGTALEIHAVRLALRALPSIPDPIRLNVNVSPETLYSDEFLHAVADVDGSRLVVEVTEHAAIDDYEELRRASARLSALSIRLAIDDVGMGFSGLNRILESNPSEVKLDAVVVRNVDTNPVKQALVEAFCGFGERTGVDIVAEGIETPGELQALRSLGVRIGQGYALGRPGPLDRAIR